MLRVQVAAVVAVLLGGAAAAADGFKVITDPSTAASQIKRESLAAFFLKQAPRWSDGRPVLPVDQSLRSPVRAVFSREVLKQGLPAVSQYWQKQINSRRVAAARLPPPVKGSDAEVARYVKANPGAVGYVSGGFALPAGLKVLLVVD